MNRPDNQAQDRQIGKHGARVFIGEDDQEIRDMLAAALRSNGHWVFEAADGLDLLRLVQAFRSERPRIHRDVVVTDVNMPGVSGLEVLATMRRMELVTPVVIVTGFGDADTHARAWRLGASAVFDKPFDLAELQQTVLWLAVSGSRPDNTNGVS